MNCSTLGGSAPNPARMCRGSEPPSAGSPCCEKAKGTCLFTRIRAGAGHGGHCGELFLALPSEKPSVRSLREAHVPLPATVKRAPVGSRPVLLRAQSPREIRDRCRLWVNHTVFAGRPACLLYPRYYHDSACAASVARGYFQTFVMRQSKARAASPTDSRRAGGRAGRTAARLCKTRARRRRRSISIRSMGR